MRIRTILNNNAVIAVDENGKEAVIVKNGIGFGSKKNQKLKDDDMQKVFILQESASTVSAELIDLLSSIDERYIEVSKKIVKYGRENLDAKIHDSIYVTLSDHIRVALKRKQSEIIFDNSMNWSIRRIYRDEYHVGAVALSIIEKECGVRLPEEEAGLIAWHFVNAEIGDTSDEMHDVAFMTSFIQKTLNFVKYYLGKELDEESIAYYRLLRYLQSIALRIEMKQQIESSRNRFDEEMIELAKHKQPRAYQCSEKIGEMIRQDHHSDISTEEFLQLIMHISRFSE